MSSTPDVSVVVPTKDRWPLLSAHALPSALGQTGIDLEVVVVDDGSSDETRAQLERIAGDRVRVLRLDPSRRLPGARNAGAAEARGRWLAFLDDDDLWAPDKLRLQVEAGDAADRPWVYGRALVVDADARPIGVDPFPQPEELGELLLHGNWVPGGGSNVIVRSDLFRRAGGFDEELRFFEDWDLWLRLLEHALPMPVDELVMARVEHGGNMVVRDRSEVAAAFERVLGKHRTVTPADRRGVAEWLALEQHRAGRRLAAARMFLSVALSYRSLGNLPPAVGSLFGRRGLEAASWLLTRIRGASHLQPASDEVSEPPWLAAYR